MTNRPLWADPLRFLGKNGWNHDGRSLAVRLSYRQFTAMKTTPSSDRRASERFDVVGSLWGQLELPEVATVVNVSSAGLLVEAGSCPVLNSVHAVRMLVDGDAVSVDAVVRHCHLAAEGRYRIGLEFVTVPTTVLMSIEQLGADAQVEVIDLEASRS